MNKSRVIIVPLNQISSERLDFGINYDEISENDYSIWKMNQVEFETIFQTGIFNKINQICDVIIDDFESERIEYSNINNALLAIHQSGIENIGEIDKLGKMLKLAEENKTFVEFDF